MVITHIYFNIYELFNSSFFNLKPLEVRESKGSSDLLKINKLGFWNESEEEAKKLINKISAVELGRIVTRDIGGSDPERMSSSNVVAYVQKALESTDIKV